MTALPSPDDIFRKGDVVEISDGERTVDATVKLASPNGASLFVTFEAIVAGYVGAMPLLYENGVFRAVVGGATISVKRKLNA